MNANLLKVGPALLALSLVLVGAFATRGQDQGQGGLRKFMRQKLEHSQKVLEGLALEDFAMIAENARELKELSEDARWRVSPDINYLRLSSQFQDLAEELAQDAKDKNIDGATLAYVQMTVNCVACHKLVRDKKLLSFAR